jgi:hypothetical protein
MPENPDYDIALSFAGEERAYVDRVADSAPPFTVIEFQDGSTISGSASWFVIALAWAANKQIGRLTGEVRRPEYT